MEKKDLLEYGRKLDDQTKKELGKELDNMTPEQRKAFADEVFPLQSAMPVFLNSKLFYSNPRVGGGS